jgi:hypothetical protein
MKRPRFSLSGRPVLQSKLAAVLSAAIVLSVALAATLAPASAQTPPPVNFVSGHLFSGVGVGGRIPVAANVYTFAVGDFNKDGKLDLITTSSDGNFGLNLGDGDGTFQAPIGVTGVPGAGMGGIAAGDFNKDGNLDFATVWNVGGPMQLAVYLGDGAGHLTHANSYPVGTGTGHPPRMIAAADLDLDGNLDLIVPDFENSAVALLYGKGNGSFDNAVEFPAGVLNQTAPSAVAIGDFNKDGKPDIVVSSTNAYLVLGGISVLLNTRRQNVRVPRALYDPDQHRHGPGGGCRSESGWETGCGRDLL